MKHSFLSLLAKSPGIAGPLFLYKCQFLQMVCINIKFLPAVTGFYLVHQSIPSHNTARSIAITQKPRN